MNIQRKIKKLLTALSIKGYIYLVNREQFLSNISGRICTVHKLFHLMPVEEYNKLYPDDKKDPEKHKFVKLKILSTFRQEEILITLVNIYKKAGDSSG